MKHDLVKLPLAHSERWRVCLLKAEAHKEGLNLARDEVAPLWQHSR